MTINIDFSEWESNKINFRVNTENQLKNWSYCLTEVISQVVVEQVFNLNGNQQTISNDNIRSANQYRLEISWNDQMKCHIEKITFVTPLREFSKEAKWITGRVLPNDERYYKDSPSIILERKFKLMEKPKLCVLNLVGLGYFQVEINGKSVTNNKLINDWSNVEKRIYYYTYDITSLLKENNTIKIELGNGWYNPSPLKLFGKHSLQTSLVTGNPCAKALITVRYSKRTETIKTDNKWIAYTGKLLFNNIYLGEKYDFGKKRSEYYSAREIAGPKGKFIPSFIPQQKILSTFLPLSIKKLGNEGLLIDFGKICEGFINILINGNNKQKVKLIYGESLNNKDEVDTYSTRAGQIGPIGDFELRGGSKAAPFPAAEIDCLLLKNGKCHFENKFSYHSFRYVKIRGIRKEQLLSIKAEVVATDQKFSGSIETSDLQINKLLEAAIKTKINNTHSIFEDCAREHFGYLGDMAELLKSQLYFLDSQSLLKKTVLDIVDTQTKDGAIAETVPYVGINSNGAGLGGPLSWQIMLPYSIFQYIRFYGKQEWLDKIKPSLEKHLTFLNNLVNQNVDNMCLGDWGSADSVNNAKGRTNSPAQAFTAQCTLLLMLRLYKSLAKDDLVVGQYLEKDCEYLQYLIKKRFSNGDGTFADKSQTSYAYALLLKLSDQPETTFKLLIKNIQEHGGQLRTGIFATPILYQVLSRSGNTDLVWNWLHQTGEHTMLHMLDDGNGTLKEHLFLKPASLNHAMYASYLEWCFEYILGIRNIDCRDGSIRLFVEIGNRPKKLHSASGFFQTSNGLIKVDWHTNRNEQTIEKISIPDRTTLLLQKSKVIISKITQNDWFLKGNKYSVEIKAGSSLMLKEDQNYLILMSKY